MRVLPQILAALLFVASAGAATDPGECDRTGDGTITVLDAFRALRDAVDYCHTSYECDSDGDYTLTASDALVLLRHAVDLPADLQCSCIAIDQCFGDEDCIEGYPPGFYCAAYLCVECEFDEECGDGEVCSPCRLECVPEE